MGCPPFGSADRLYYLAKRRWSWLANSRDRYVSFDIDSMCMGYDILYIWGIQSIDMDLP